LWFFGYHHDILGNDVVVGFPILHAMMGWTLGGSKASQTTLTSTLYAQGSS